MTLREYIKYVCQVSGLEMPKPVVKTTVPVTVDGMDRGLRLVIVEPRYALDYIRRKFRNFDQRKIFLNGDTPLCNCAKKRRFPKLTCINIVLSGDPTQLPPTTKKATRPKKTVPSREQEEMEEFSTPDLRARLGTEHIEDNTKTVKFGKGATASREYESPGNLEPMPELVYITPQQETGDGDDIPELVPINPEEGKATLEEDENPPEMVLIVPQHDVSTRHDSRLEPMTPKLVPMESCDTTFGQQTMTKKSAIPAMRPMSRVTAVANANDAVNVDCALLFCGYVNRYRKSCDVNFPHGRCLVFMVRDSDMTGRTDMKQNGGDLAGVVESMANDKFGRFFQRHVAGIPTECPFDAFIAKDQTPESTLVLDLADSGFKVEMLRRNGEFSVLKPRPVKICGFVQHPDDRDIWIALVEGPLVLFKN